MRVSGLLHERLLSPLPDLLRPLGHSPLCSNIKARHTRVLSVEASGAAFSSPASPITIPSVQACCLSLSQNVHLIVVGAGPQGPTSAASELRVHLLRRPPGGERAPEAVSRCTLVQYFCKDESSKSATASDVAEVVLPEGASELVCCGSERRGGHHSDGLPRDGRVKCGRRHGGAHGPHPRGLQAHRIDSVIPERFAVLALRI